ncbi:vomeronasal type-1 receptor 2-like [Phoca vitulina]|uniref:vomeronasal type-1 receptor 2-like n=1 Tax=Phoca vitulina TaxID=9720 RepID=UPI0013963624|nr:vomeronasal type-1 receptor 2-like [Phoca vitulina]
MVLFFTSYSKNGQWCIHWHHCFLSVFQSITIGPRNSKIIELKIKAPRYLSNKQLLDPGHADHTITTCCTFNLPSCLRLGFVIWASISIVFNLLRYKQRVEHIHRNNISSRISPDMRATQSILVLVSTFVSFYALSSTFSFYLALSENPSWWLLNPSALITPCFPTISPFVLWSHDLIVSRVFSACCKRNTQLPKTIQ